MKIKIVIASLACAMTISTTGYANDTVTYYCAPTSDIVFTPQTDSWAPYEYSSPNKSIYNGLQPALVGWGSAYKASGFKSAVWTDQSLACNYFGVTGEQTSEVMVMVSNTIGESPTCQFPTGQGNKSQCSAPNPENCPMVCKEGERR